MLLADVACATPLAEALGMPDSDAPAVMLLARLACAVALPLAAWLQQRYLSEFVERAPMGVWPLVIAVLALVTVTALAVLRHLLAAFRLRPARALQG
jgi:TRAP-type C4-dicarboxylate transport system permease small subunit